MPNFTTDLLVSVNVPLESKLQALGEPSEGGHCKCACHTTASHQSSVVPQSAIAAAAPMQVCSPALLLMKARVYWLRSFYPSGSMTWHCLASLVDDAVRHPYCST
eukprot:scaffold3768_cov376-Prasinococcus_capsulatus_cf.AAC.28